VTAAASVECSFSASQARRTTIYAAPAASVTGLAAKVGALSAGGTPAVIAYGSTHRFGTSVVTAVSDGTVEVTGGVDGRTVLRSFIYLLGSIEEVALLGAFPLNVSLLGGWHLTEVNQNFTM
jgi:hypothetical protein